MAAITASMVAELRGKTDAPMMECKRALTEAEGDMAKAEELLRVKLGSKAGKAAGRITAEGVVTSYIADGVGALLEVNCETDFVTKNDSFLALANAAAELIVKNNPADIEALGCIGLRSRWFWPDTGRCSQRLDWQDWREHEFSSFQALFRQQAGCLLARYTYWCCG